MGKFFKAWTPVLHLHDTPYLKDSETQFQNFILLGDKDYLQQNIS